MLLPPHPARCSLALGATLSHNKGRGKAKASVRQALSISQFARPKIAPRRTIVVRAEKNDHQRPFTSASILRQARRGEWSPPPAPCTMGSYGQSRGFRDL